MPEHFLRIKEPAAFIAASYHSSRFIGVCFGVGVQSHSMLSLNCLMSVVEEMEYADVGVHIFIAL